ncbi:testis-expressed protein 264-like isoform X2 [Myxocyprinus asiaticus]|uniref:testis-expressed protein 264-like isoform X2 n=1 Tax=Myxocyprinus asiaticus TaxID=70543 RepID=UPI0022212CDF|nr:testis-expressed protein 264-like isoform X2 [Myxocyprinus asiaticus]
MSDFVTLFLILFLVVCLILTLVGFVFYTGLLSEVVVRTGSPPVKKITIAYKFSKGSYKASGAVFTESCSIGPKLSSVGVFYDDPNQTQADQCRYVVGSILSENEEKPDEQLQRLYEKFGYMVISFPEVTCAVTSSFPNRCALSPICGAYRVYPELEQYIKPVLAASFPLNPLTLVPKPGKEEGFPSQGPRHCRPPRGAPLPSDGGRSSPTTRMRGTATVREASGDGTPRPPGAREPLPGAEECPAVPRERGGVERRPPSAGGGGKSDSGPPGEERLQSA